MEENEEYVPQYEETRPEYTSDGKRIIASISVENEIYYMDENKNIFEKVGKVYLEITNPNIIEKVKRVLAMPTNDLYMDY